MPNADSSTGQGMQRSASIGTLPKGRLCGFVRQALSIPDSLQLICLAQLHRLFSLVSDLRSNTTLSCRQAGRQDRARDAQTTFLLEHRQLRAQLGILVLQLSASAILRQRLLPQLLDVERRAQEFVVPFECRDAQPLDLLGGVLRTQLVGDRQSLEKRPKMSKAINGSSNNASACSLCRSASSARSLFALVRRAENQPFTRSIVSFVRDASSASFSSPGCGFLSNSATKRFTAVLSNVFLTFLAGVVSGWSSELAFTFLAGVLSGWSSEMADILVLVPSLEARC